MSTELDSDWVRAATALKVLDRITDPSTRPTFGEPVDYFTETSSENNHLPSGVPQEKAVNVNRYGFPAGDPVEKWNPFRIAYARGKVAQHGEAAYRKYAPYESAYIDAMQKANMGEYVSGVDGGFVSPEIWQDRFFDRLYAASLIGQLPVTRIPLRSRVEHFPVLTTGATVAYSAENAALSSSSQAFRQVTLVPKKQAALCYVSNELLVDSEPAAQGIIQQNIIREMQQDFDKQAFLGNGQSGTPTGIINQTNVSSGTTAGAHLTYQDLTAGVMNVMLLNNSTNVGVGQANCTGIAANPILLKQVANFTDSNSRLMWDFGLRGMPLPGDNNGLASFLGVPKVAVSNVLPVTEGGQDIVFGDWQYCVIGERSDMEVMVSNVAGTAFAQDQTAFRVIRRWDIVLAHPEAFYYLKSVSS